jgi:molybdopterin/thiamine biosynthesis adenylyltransferase
MNASLPNARVLMVGAGGLGCPAAIILAKSGVGRIDIADDDVVDVSNVQRQTLFGIDDASKPKARLASERLIAIATREGHTLQSTAFETRLLPDNATAIVSGYDVVLEGADNFASKFLVADACRIAGVSVVQAGAVRWSGWALGVDRANGPCLRCVFEDVPRGVQDTCAAAGVVGPVVGAVAALQAAIALRMLLDDTRAAGQLVRYTALDGRVRRTSLARQHHCPLCAGQITDTRVERYVPADCAA